MQTVAPNGAPGVRAYPDNQENGDGEIATIEPLALALPVSARPFRLCEYNFPRHGEPCPGTGLRSASGI